MEKFVRTSNGATLSHGGNKRTKVQMSTVEGAGYGLFADCNFAEGAKICVYGGVIYENMREYLAETNTSIDDESNCYLISLKKERRGRLPRILDGEVGFRLWEQGRWANTRKLKNRCNAYYHEMADESNVTYEVQLRASKQITKGDEIFVWYAFL